MCRDRYAERNAPVGISAALRQGMMRVWLLILAASFSWTAQAGEHRFQLLLDTDNLPATGCSLVTAKGTVTGIEQVWTTVVTTTTSTATVTRIERQACIGTTLQPPTVHAAAGWPAGIGNGSSN